MTWVVCFKRDGSQIRSVHDLSELQAERLVESLTFQQIRCFMAPDDCRPTEPVVISPAGHSLPRQGNHYDRVMSDTSRMLIEEALAKTDGNKKQAARLLGIPRSTLNSILDRVNGRGRWQGIAA